VQQTGIRKKRKKYKRVPLNHSTTLEGDFGVIKWTPGLDSTLQDQNTSVVQTQHSQTITVKRASPPLPIPTVVDETLFMQAQAPMKATLQESDTSESKDKKPRTSISIKELLNPW
jgi:hypothetical protein